MSRPPRLAEWLLASRVRPVDRPMVLGDLSEQFQAFLMEHGALRASAWYWRQVAGIGLGLAWTEPREQVATGRVMAMDDAKYAWRRIRKQPLTSLASIVTLALGIGAAAATWSLISTVLLHPVQISEPDRVVRVRQTVNTSRGAITSTGFSYPGAQTIQAAQLMPFAAWGAIGPRSPMMVEVNGEKAVRGIRFTTPNFLDVLGVQPALGRYFSEAEDQADAPLVTVVSNRFWRRFLGGDPNVIGREILVRDRPTRIIGVLPQSFRGLEVRSNPDLLMPLRAIEFALGYPPTAGQGNLFGDRPPVHWVGLVGRLPEGVSAAAMADRLRTIDIESAPELKESTLDLIDVERAALDDASRTDLRKFATLLGSTVGLLLAIGSLTVGTLLLIRTEARRSEFATCLALGAGRWRLASGVALEGLMLTVLGVALSLPVSLLLFTGIGGYQLPGSIRMSLLDMTIDRGVMAGAALAAAVSVLAIAGIASVFALRGNVGSALRSQGSSIPLTRRRSRAALVTAQVAVALVLVTGTSLFATSLTRALSLNPGVDTSLVFKTAVDPGGIGYDDARRNAFFDRVREQLSTRPEVSAVALSRAKFGTKQLVVDGHAEMFESYVSLQSVDAQFLKTLALPVLAGRAITDDDRTGTTPVAVVSAGFARAIAGDGSALGRRLGPAPKQGLTTSVEIVGVVSNIAHPQSLNPLAVYLPSTQYSHRSYPGDGGTDLTVRATRDKASAERAVREVVRAIEPNLVLPAMTSIDENILASMAPQQFGATVMGALGAIALLLSVLGAYVLAETSAVQRRREMGIRAALGGSGHHLRMLLFSETFRLVGLGLLLGFGLSWLGAGTIRSFLFQVDPLDPWVTAGVAATILFLSLAVCVRPAVSAARTDLATVLRDD